jgi:hypothetical protein
MGSRRRTKRSSRDVFARLGDHGVENYGIIKKIVALDLPQWRLFFARQFERRTISQVLRQVERWKAFLSRDFLLLPNQKAELEKWIQQAELLVWSALIESNWEVGPWRLGFSFVPTGQDDCGSVYIFPGQRIVALNVKTKETREALIPGEEFNDPARCGDAYRRAFKTLGIWSLLMKGPPGQGVISARRPQGWPVFTQIVIPRLYEYLIPYYQEPGHYSERIDSAEVRRHARFPGELLRDMLDILQMEHPHFFSQTTLPQLKAAIQKYLYRRTKSTKLPI